MPANFPNKALQRMLAAYLVTAADVRAALVMSNTTADTDKDAIDYMSNITTLDECDATGYARVALVSEAANVDDTNDRGEFDANDISFTGLGGDATRDYVGIVLYKHVTNDTDSEFVVFLPFPATKAGTSTGLDITFNAEGIIQLSQA